jgi:hypothetical protein
VFDRLTRLDPGDLPPGNILNIAGNTTVGWYVAHRQRNKIVLYHSQQLDRGTWQAVRTENIEHTFWPFHPSFWMWPSDVGFFYAVNDGRIVYYEYATQSWSERRVPKNYRISAVAPNRGNISVLASTSGDFFASNVQTYLTFDGGANWETIKLPFNAKFYAPRIVDDRTLVVVGEGKSSNKELHVSTDRGKTWRLLNSKFDVQNNIIPVATQGLLAVRWERGSSLISIQHSTDNGATWQLEYSNYDEGLFERR